MKTHLEVIADGSYRDLSDEEVMRYAYAARYANYQGSVRWKGEMKTYTAIFKELGLTWEEYLERNRELLERIAAIEEQKAQETEEKLKRGTASQARDIIAPADTTSTRVSYGTGRCRRCGKKDSHWNPSAGEYLCDRHWDDY